MRKNVKENIMRIRIRNPAPKYEGNSTVLPEYCLEVLCIVRKIIGLVWICSVRYVLFQAKAYVHIELTKRAKSLS
jgi:hypothetical protein